jgi:hypothetical protein
VGVDFPYRVTRSNVLPEPFAAVAPPAMEMIFIPPQSFERRGERRWQWNLRWAEPSRALALGEERLWVLEEGEEGIARHEVAFDELLEVEIGNVLLHAWVAFRPEEAVPIRLDFNLAALPIFEDIVNRILLELRGDKLESSSKNSAELSGLDLKFRNALRGRLLLGEALKTVTFAPAVWARRLLILRKRLVAATALAATDWRLLVVEEGEAVGETTYGSTAYSISRDRIASMECTTEGVVVSFRTKGRKHERRIPLSDPEGAIPVIDAIVGGAP